MPTSLSLALRIGQFIEDHSESEISEAILILEKHGCHSELLDYLAHRKIERSDKKNHPNEESSQKSEDTISRAVLHLRDSDPEKFRLLSEFELGLRNGQILGRLEDLKRFGERIGKDFQSRKSRKGTISAFLSILTKRSLSEIERIIESSITFGVTSGTDQYQRLAQFIIKGKSPIDPPIVE